MYSKIVLDLEIIRLARGQGCWGSGELGKGVRNEPGSFSQGIA